MSRSIKEFREQLTEEDVKRIVESYGVTPHHELPNAIIFPTCCHNLDGGKPKLYYYKQNNMFRCYTECNEVFDIFELIIKLESLRGNEITLGRALEIAGFDNRETIKEQKYYGVKKQLDYLYEINNTVVYEPEEIEKLDEDIVYRYTFSLDVLKIWINEGINPRTLNKYHIRYDSVSNAIVIPHYDDENNLVGIRGRFLSEDAPAKYMPMKFSGKFLAHPTSKLLYGLNNTKEAIQKHKMAIIFEGEKSVLKMDSIYGSDNISVAVSGKNITVEHIQLLMKYGVKNIVLAFDRDYLSYDELQYKLKEYSDLVKYMKNYFNVSIIMDYDLVLPYKESPIDKGKEVFEELMRYKIHL